VISFYDNMDATDVFAAFHGRSEKAQKWLETLPRRAVTKDDPSDASPLVNDFRQLQRDLVREGMYDPAWVVQTLRLLEVLALQVFGLWVVLNYSWVLGGLIYGIVVGRNGLLMHDMGHRGFFCNMRLDKAIHTYFFGMSITGSATFWNNQHNKHHAATQELNHDTDLATLPIVAFHKAVAKDGSPSYLRFQWLVFLPAQLLLFFYWKFTHFRHAMRTGNWPEAGSIIMHQVLTLAVCLRGGAGVWGWLVYQAIGYAWGGFYLATTFSMNHTVRRGEFFVFFSILFKHRPVAEQHAKRNWVVRSVEYTTNVTPSPFAQWLTGYLCFQVEVRPFAIIDLLLC
jgi:fatty acid desaturase